MAKKDLPARASSRAVATVSDADWNAAARAAAVDYKQAEANVGVGQFMSTRGGILAFQGTPVPGNRMRAIILDSVHVNSYYAGEFDPDSPSSPVCFAIGRTDTGLTPHESATDKQADECSGCPQNKFGSAEKGRGKACKNGRRLILIHADALSQPETIKETAMAMLNIPPTSLPSWAGYVKSLEATTGLAPFAVVTEIAVVPDAKSQFKVTFTLINKIENKRARGPIMEKRKEAMDVVGTPFAPNEDGGDAKKAKKQKPTAKKPAPVASKPKPSKPAPVAEKKSGKAKF